MIFFIVIFEHSKPSKIKNKVFNQSVSNTINQVDGKNKNYISSDANKNVKITKENEQLPLFNLRYKKLTKYIPE